MEVVVPVSVVVPVVDEGSLIVDELPMVDGGLDDMVDEPVEPPLGELRVSPPRVLLRLRARVEEVVGEDVAEGVLADGELVVDGDVVDCGEVEGIVDEDGVDGVPIVDWPPLDDWVPVDDCVPVDDWLPVPAVCAIAAPGTMSAAAAIRLKVFMSESPMIFLIIATNGWQPRRFIGLSRFSPYRRNCARLFLCLSP